MKNIKKLSFLILTLTTLFSCSYEPEIGSKITTYPLITLLGDETVFVAKGTAFVDSGAVAVEGENEIPYVKTVVGDYRNGTSIDTNIIDAYNLNYTATNVDGFNISGIRKVWVYNNGNFIDSIEGIYTSSVRRGGVLTAQYTDMEYVLIWKKADGKYEISDGLGGYYNIGRNFGLGYAAREAIITANSISGNDFSVSNFSVGAFGGNAVVSGFTIDPATKRISYTSIWDGSSNGIFEVTLTQVQP